MSLGFSDDMTCPFCKKNNHCGVAEPAGCWCMQVEVPAELVALVPVKLKGRACICGNCVAAFAAGEGLFSREGIVRAF